jgi:quinol monooxygenase YgiN
MYGTIAKMRATPGKLEALRELASTLDHAPGQVERLVFQMDSDPNEFWLIGVFESQEAYRMNAASPEQHARYLQVRALLEADPEWHDGPIMDRSVNSD